MDNRVCLFKHSVLVFKQRSSVYLNFSHPTGIVTLLHSKPDQMEKLTNTNEKGNPSKGWHSRIFTRIITFHVISHEFHECHFPLSLQISRDLLLFCSNPPNGFLRKPSQKTQISKQKEEVNVITFGISHCKTSKVLQVYVSCVRRILQDPHRKRRFLNWLHFCFEQNMVMIVLWATLPKTALESLHVSKKIRILAVSSLKNI